MVMLGRRRNITTLPGVWGVTGIAFYHFIAQTLKCFCTLPLILGSFKPQETGT